MAQIIIEIPDAEESDARQILRDALGEFGGVRGHRDGREDTYEGYFAYVERRYPGRDFSWATNKADRVGVRCRLADRMKSQT